MGMTEDTEYVGREINALCQRLCDEGIDLDLVFASMIDAAAFGYANMAGAAPMSDVFRQTADEMDAGEYTHRTVIDGPTHRFKVIEGGGGSKV